MKTKTIIQQVSNFLTIIIIIITLVIATTAGTAYAGHKPPRHHHHDGSDTAVAILGGVAVLGAIAAIASTHDDDSCRQVEVGVSYRTQPGHGWGSAVRHPHAHHRHRHRQAHPPRQWVAGHYEVKREKITRPGYWKEEICPAEYKRVRQNCGWRTIMVKPETVRKVWVPPRQHWEEKRVWIPGHWAPVKCLARAY